jgi:hypothetical protein
VFIKEPITSKLAIIFIIISISLVPSQYLGFFPVNAQLNSTGVINNQTTVPQSESNIIKPFTIPRDESNELQSTSTGDGSNASSLTQPLNDLVLLSQRYNDERFGDEIVGEVLNNGTITAEYAKVSVSFYDENGAILGSQFTYTDPSTLAPGQKAAFTIFISSDTIEDDTETYEFTLQWQDNDFNDFSKRITGEQVQAIDNDNDDNGSNNDSIGIGISRDLDCSDIGARNIQVGSNDPNRLDGDGDGIGCESGSGNNDNDNQNAVVSDNGSRCQDGFHRSPSGDCERVTDTSGMERCPNGSHRSPDGDCERVSDNNDSDNNDSDNNDSDNNDSDNNDSDNNDSDNNDSDNNDSDNNKMDNVEDSVRDSGIEFDFD